MIMPTIDPVLSLSPFDGEGDNGAVGFERTEGVAGLAEENKNRSSLRIQPVLAVSASGQMTCSKSTLWYRPGVSVRTTNGA